MGPGSVTVPIKGRRTPGKPGRFDPTEPLHMTTRHAARNGRVNGSSSVNGSVDSNDSPRESLDEARPTTSYSLGSQQSAKRGRRASTLSSNAAADIKREMDPSSSDRKDPDTNVSDGPLLSPTVQSSPPTRKRKRSSPSPLKTPNGTPAREPTPPGDMDAYSDDDGDFADGVPADQMSGQDSGGSSQSDEHSQKDYLGMAQSVEVTPAASEPVSPISEDSSMGMIATSKRSEVLVVDDDQVLEHEELEEVEDLADGDDVDDVDGADDIDEADDQARADDDGAPRRRFWGRRRAEHHEPQIEAIMRRQLHLKSAFRAIARALKPVLAEIAEKTVENLNAQPHLHTQVLEYHGNDDYEGVQETLDRTLAKRKAQLAAQLKWSQWQLSQTLEAEEKVRRSMCQRHIEECREDHLDQLEHKFLMIARQAQLGDDGSDCETEDEDGDVIPKLKGMAYRSQRLPALDVKYDSRTRVVMESRRAIDELQARYKMHEMLQAYDTKVDANRKSGFTVMHAEPRDAALARQASFRNTALLANAAEEFEREAAEKKRQAAEAERRAKIPVIRNEDAEGLQLLGGLAMRPSIRAHVPPKHPFGPGRQPPQSPRSQVPRSPAMQDPQMFMNPATGNHISQMPPPPPLRPPFHLDNSPIETSPRMRRYSMRGDPAPSPPYPYLLQHFDPFDREPLPSSGSPHGSHVVPLSTRHPDYDFTHRRDTLNGQRMEAQSPYHHHHHHHRHISETMEPPPEHHLGGFRHADFRARQETSWELDRFDPASLDPQLRVHPPFPHDMATLDPQLRQALPPMPQQPSMAMHRPIRGDPLLRIVAVPRDEAESSDPHPALPMHQARGKADKPGRQSAVHKGHPRESPSSPGASDGRRQGSASIRPEFEPRPSYPAPPDLSVDIPLAQRSRASSLNQSAHDLSPVGSQSDAGASRQDGQDPKNAATAKPPRVERRGMSRKAWKNFHASQQRKKSPTLDGPSMHRFRLDTHQRRTRPPKPQPVARPPAYLQPRAPSYQGSPPSAAATAVSSSTVPASTASAPATPAQPSNFSHPSPRDAAQAVHSNDHHHHQPSSGVSAHPEHPHDYPYPPPPPSRHPSDFAGPPASSYAGIDPQLLGPLAPNNLPPGGDYAQHYHHRSSFPPPPTDGPQPWTHPPPSPLYAVPQGPPGGPPPHQWQHQGHYVPPPSLTSRPPSSSDGPRQLSAALSPAVYGQQFGGPTLAPAPSLSSNERFPRGPGPPPLPPAFAQQARQHEDSGRRRTASELGLPVIRQWKGPRKDRP